MDIEALKRGDMDALGAAVDACVVDVWRLARRGFLTQKEVLIYVGGIDAPDAAETIVSRIIAAVLTPARRAELSNAVDLKRAALFEARERLLSYGVRTGRGLSIADDSEKEQIPECVENLDEIIRTDRSVTESDIPVDIERVQRSETAAQICERCVEAFDERSHQLVVLRWKESKTHKEIATSFDCGIAAVKERERRVRHRIRHALRQRWPDDQFKDAEIDHLLAGSGASSTPPAVTLERLKHDVLKRTFQQEPPPFSQRAIWAVAVGAVAATLWGLMLAGVLPYYDDDRYPEPRIELACAPSCTAGSETKIRVLGPRNSKFVAVAVAVEGQTVGSLLVDPSGGSVQLPLGANVQPVEIAYPVTVPSVRSKRAHAVALFSERELSRTQIENILSGDSTMPKILTTSTSIPIRSQ